MAVLVEEIMNRELFTVRPGDTAGLALRCLLLLGITGAPVVDENHRPVGMISVRDFVGRKAGETVRERMSVPVVSALAKTSIQEAGRLLAESGYHRLVAVDADGKAVGMVSSLDVVRGLLGLPAAHPATFPHYDKRTGLTWTEDRILSFERVEAAPDDPGLLVLVLGGAGVHERIVWAEASVNVRGRLIEMLAQPSAQPSHLVAWLGRPELRFRTAKVVDPEQREAALTAAVEEMRDENQSHGHVH